jgi:hypothetical protein
MKEPFFKIKPVVSVGLSDTCSKDEVGNLKKESDVYESGERRDGVFLKSVQLTTAWSTYEGPIRTFVSGMCARRASASAETGNAALSNSRGYRFSTSNNGPRTSVSIAAVAMAASEAAKRNSSVGLEGRINTRALQAEHLISELERQMERLTGKPRRASTPGEQRFGVNLAL